MATFDDVRATLAALPGCEEGTSYGTPGFRVRKKFLCRLRDEGRTLVVKVDMDEREALLQSGSDAYFTLPHYDGYPAVLVRLAEIDRDELAELLELSWRIHAPARLVTAYDSGS